MQAKLIVFRENGERREFSLADGKTSIGRGDDCDIRIPVAEVSRHHAEVMLRGNVAMINDQSSANGTFVNNRREKAVELHAGDHLIIGPVVFIVQINGQPKDIKPIRSRAPQAKSGAVMSKAGAKAGKAGSGELDPISALEALASSTDQTAIDPFPDEDE